MKISIFIMISAMIMGLVTSCSDGSNSSDSGSQSTGTAGSMARFQVIDNYLYAITTSWRLSLFDISDPSSPSHWLNINVSTGIETLYHYNNYLFIGANNGVLIFDNKDPSAPTQISSFSHVQSCDPVVVENSYAYATLRGGTRCRSTINQLDVIDLSNIYNPILVNSIPMSNPKGLGISSGNLFVCDRDKLIRYDASNPIYPIETDRISLYDCFDVIPTRNSLIVSHGDGISQYDYSSAPLTFISNIATLQ